MRNLSNENVIQIEKNGRHYLQFKKLLEYEDEIKHAYTIGTDVDFRSRTEEELGISSYKKLSEDLNEDMNNLIKPNQEHTGNVKIVSKKINFGKPDMIIHDYDKTDGLITNKKNFALSTTNADCILMLFYDPINKVIANVHSGWRGTIARISINTVDKMIKEYNCNTKDIICCFTPSIRKCHFEVDKDVKDMFENEFQDIINEYGKEEIIEEKIKNKKWNIDTIRINQILLKNKGLMLENIIDSGICTVCNSDIIHSFRSEKEIKGLETAIIELK